MRNKTTSLKFFYFADLCFKTNLSIVNALWMILSGERFDLNDQGLVNLVRSVEKARKNY